MFTYKPATKLYFCQIYTDRRPTRGFIARFLKKIPEYVLFGTEKQLTELYGNSMPTCRILPAVGNCVFLFRLLKTAKEVFARFCCFLLLCFLD